MAHRDFNREWYPSLQVSNYMGAKEKCIVNVTAWTWWKGEKERWKTWKHDWAENGGKGEEGKEGERKREEERKRKMGWQVNVRSDLIMYEEMPPSECHLRNAVDVYRSHTDVCGACFEKIEKAFRAVVLSVMVTSGYAYQGTNTGNATTMRLSQGERNVFVRPYKETSFEIV